VARVLLHGTKAMLAHTWLPWVSVNHLHGITGLEELDPSLLRRLASGQ
jgi:hypothetical protein